MKYDVKFDVRWTLDYDYNEFRDCSRHGCDSICRCSEITDTKVLDSSSVNFENVDVYEVYNKPRRGRAPRPKVAKRTDIDNYCIQRILVHHRVYNNDLYEFDIVKGYYGEEINDVVHENTWAIKADIERLLDFDTDLEKVHFVLNLEYGYIAETIKRFDGVCIEMVDLTKLADADAKMIKRQDSYLYELDLDPAKGICYRGPQGSDYTLVDGHHRLSYNLTQGETKARYLVLYNKVN